MNKIVVGFLAVLILTGCQIKTSNSVTNTVKNSIDKVAYIRSFQKLSINNQPIVGAGFVATSNGYVFTCAHVVGDSPDDIIVTVKGKDFKANLVGRNKAKDIALLKLNSFYEMEHFTFSAKQPQPGDTVIAMGHPFDELYYSVTTGVISGVNRSVKIIGFENPVVNSLQISAPVNPGNSGGPLFGSDGKIVGMVFSYYGFAQNVGFAVPTEELNNFALEFNVKLDK